jgi:hypothetical protein
MRRSEFATAIGAAALLGASAPGKIEQPTLRVATAVAGTSQLPLFVAAAKTIPASGLTVNLTDFRGDAGHGRISAARQWAWLPTVRSPMH